MIDPGTLITVLDAFYASVGDIIRSGSDVAYLMTLGTQEESHVNLVCPGQFTLLPVGTPVFEPWKGVRGAAGSFYDTGFIPNVHAKWMTSSIAEIDVFVLSNEADPVNGSPAECGNAFNLVKALETQLVSGAPTTIGGRITRAATFRTPTITAANGLPTTAVGLTSVSRFGQPTRIRRNGVTIATAGGAPVGLGNTSLTIGGFHSDTAPGYS